MKEAVAKKTNKIISSIKLHRRLASDFDKTDSENRERNTKNFCESLISRIEEFQGFRENKISRKETSSVFKFREKA